MPGAASGCLACLLARLLVTGTKHRCAACMTVYDLLGRDTGDLGMGAIASAGAVPHVAALAAALL